MALSRGAMGLFAVFDCGISEPYPLTIFDFQSVPIRSKLTTKSSDYDQETPQSPNTYHVENTSCATIDQAKHKHYVSTLCYNYKYIVKVVFNALV